MSHHSQSPIFREWEERTLRGMQHAGWKNRLKGECLVPDMQAVASLLVWNGVAAMAGNKSLSMWVGAASCLTVAAFPFAQHKLNGQERRNVCQEIAASLQHGTKTRSPERVAQVIAMSAKALER